MRIFYNLNVLVIIFTTIKCSASYMHYNLEDDDLCSFVVKKKIKLGKDHVSGLIVNQSRLLNDHVLEWNEDFTCKFRVINEQNGGVFAVIQHLNLRKNVTTDQCIDYVQFELKHGMSRQFCGEFSAESRMDRRYSSHYKPYELIAVGNSILEEDGQVAVIIHISKAPLERIERGTISLGIVFTAFKDCRDVSRRDRYRPCGNSREYRDFCIYEGFFNDSLVNCPFIDCVDEGRCWKPPQYQHDKSSMGNKVLIGSISSLIIMFVTFIICIWICRSYRVFCWSDNFANPTTPSVPSAPQPQNPRLELNEQTGATNRTDNHSASAPVEADKDLPPSYDSLFPDR